MRPSLALVAVGSFASSFLLPACGALDRSAESIDPRLRGPAEPKISLELAFDRAKQDALPAGFHAFSGEWRVVEDATAPSAPNVLVQRGKAADDAKSPYHVVLLDDVRAGAVELTVKLRAISGDEEQGGGLVWRAQDARNYYLARWNPLERNVRLFEVVDGERRGLASETVRADAGWHELKITMKGEQMRCSFDGRTTISAKDSSFLEPGKVGLWAKSDAETAFDDLRIAGSPK